jgi:NIMA (never in mitosis gene a)-related kinase
VDGKKYVLKTINIAGMDRRGQDEAINEVHILASLDCPYIVKYFDSFIEQKVLHIIMEFCARGDLCNLLKVQAGRMLSEARVWRFFLQMCLGLEYLHSKKILHRDIKSMNVFLADKDSVRIGDLGVAKVLTSTAAYAHTMVGTPYYLSPELCEERPYNAKSDVWALGCVLYELCTLKPPFDALNQGALILKIIRGKFTPVGDAYSEELRDLVNACLAKDTRKRPSVKQILLRPGIKEKAAELGVAIPQDSVLSQIFLRVEGQLMTPSVSVRPLMPTIEEEIVTQPFLLKEVPKSARAKVLPSRPIRLRNLSDQKRPPQAPPLKKKAPVPVEALKPVTPFRRDDHSETKGVDAGRMQVIERPSKRSRVTEDFELEDVPEILTVEEEIGPVEESIQDSESLEEVITDNELDSPPIYSPDSSASSYSDSFERAEGSLDSADEDRGEPPRVSTPTEDQAWLYGLQDALAVTLN